MLIVIATKVQDTMNGVQENLSFGGQSVAWSFAGRGFNADDDLAGRRVALLMERKSQDVGRSVQPEKSPVQVADRAVVDQCEFDPRCLNAFGAQHSTNDRLELWGIDPSEPLLVCDHYRDSIVEPRPSQTQ